MSYRFIREAFEAGYSAGLARQIKYEIKMSLVTNDPEIKECAKRIVDYLESDMNGVVDLVREVGNGSITSASELQEYVGEALTEMSYRFTADMFNAACKVLFDCAKVVAEALPMP